MLNKLFRRRPLIEELEPRILFSADLAPFALDSLAPMPEQRVINTEGEFSSVAATLRNELVIVDSGVQDYETLLADILGQAGNDRHFSVVILDASRDGIEQISDVLKQYGDLDAVHLISHGGPGALQLGNSQLDAASLDRRAAEIADWRNAFHADADWLIYGCDVAAGAEGEAFVRRLGTLTQTDVAGSDDLTGSGGLGGDWTLEFRNGAIETSVILDERNVGNWQGVLVKPELLDTVNPLVMAPIQQITTVPPVPSGPLGDLVSSLIDTVDGSGRDNFADPDGPGIGITINGATLNGGKLFYSPDDGANWTEINVGTLSNSNSFLLPADATARIYYQPAQNYTGYISNLLSIRAWDQSAGSPFNYADTTGGGANAFSSGQKNIAGQVTVSGTNAAPTASNQNVAELYTLNTTLDLTNIVVSDTDSGNVSVTLTLSDAGAGALTTGTSGTTTSSFSAGQWRVKGDLFDVNALLASVSFVPTTGYMSDFSIAVSITDGLAAPVTGVKLMSVINVAPAVTTTGSALNYTENDPATVVDAGLVVTDAVPGTLTGATVSLTGNYASGQDLLAFTNQLGISGIWDADTGVLTLTGTTSVANYETALRSVTYFNASESPSTLTRTVSFIVNDGTSPSAAATRTVTVAAKNDAPENTVSGAQTTAKNTTLVFSSANGNALSIADVDADSATVETTLTVTGGVLNAAAGTTGVSVTGSGTASVVLSGTLTQINTLLAGNLGGSLSYTPTTGFTGSASLQMVTNDLGASGSGGAQTDTDVISISVTDASLWLSTDGNTTSSAGSGNLSWTDGQVVSFGNPNLVLGSTTTGTFSSAINLNALADDGNIDIKGLHYVSQDTIVGTLNPISLLAGDVLFSPGGNETFGGLAVIKQDIVRFRPTTPGDYSSGSFQIVLRDPGGTNNDIRDFALVERAITVGGANLQAGDFLLVLSSGSYDKDISLFRPTDMVTPSTSGNLSLLIKGDSAGINNGGDQIWGLELVQQPITLGGQTLAAGTLLLSLDGPALVGINGLSVQEGDIFALTVTATGAASAATASMFMESIDVGLGGGGERFDALALVQRASAAPVVTVDASVLAYIENNPPSLIAPAAMVADADSINFGGGSLSVYLSSNGTLNDRLAIRNEGIGATQIGTSGSDVTYSGVIIGSFSGGEDGTTPLVISLNANATLAATQALLRNITYANVSDDPSTLPRTASVVLTDGSGGVSSTVSRTISVTATNDAPTITGVTASTAINDTGTATPFSGVVIGDVDSPAQTQTVTITLDLAAKGSLSNLGGGSYNAGTGVYSFSGTAAAATTAVQGLVFTPTANRVSPGSTETTTFTISVNDGVAPAITNSATTVVTTSVNDAPLAVADTATAVEAGGVANGTAGTNPSGNVLTNDTDVDSGDTKTVTAVSFGATPGVVSSGLAGAYGTVTLNANGSYSYVVDNTNSAVQALRTSSDTLTEVFDYTMQDTAGAPSSSTLTITITGSNDAPVAVADTATAGEAGGVANGTAGTNPSGNVLTNDTDVDSGDTKTVTAVSFGVTPGVVGSGLAGAYGTLTLNADGSYSYVINNSSATVQALRTSSDTLTEVFDYTMQDTAGAPSSSTLTITITGSNDDPVAVADTASAVEAGGVANGTAGSDPSGNVLTNDTDVDSSDTKTVTAVSFGATPGSVGSGLAGAYGTLTLNADGSYSYAVDNTNATVQALRTSSDTLTEVFSYTMQDTAGAPSGSTLTITIEGRNDDPVTMADLATAVEAGGLNNGTTGNDPTGNVLSNDTDVDSGDSKTVTAVSFGATPGSVGSGLAGAYGTLTLNADGSYSYAVDNTNATVQALRTSSDTLTEVFSYTMQDTAGATSGSTLTITITGSNDTPLAGADTATAVEAGGTANGTPGINPTGNVLTNDTDIDSGDSKTVTAVSFGATPGSVGSGLAGAYGTLTLNADGSSSYVVDNNNAAVQALRSSDTLTETFNYSLQDMVGSLDSSTLTITITGSNDTPVITSGGTHVVVEESPATIPVAAIDMESDTLSFSITGGADAAWFTVDPSSGLLSLNFVPDYATPKDANLDNLYEVTVTVSDGNGGTHTLAIKLVVADKVESVAAAPAAPPAPDVPAKLPAEVTPDKEADTEEAKPLPPPVVPIEGLPKAATTADISQASLTVVYQSATAAAPAQMMMNYVQANRNNASTSLTLVTLNQMLGGLSSDARALQLLQNSLGNGAFLQQLDQLQDTIRQQLSLDKSVVASTLAVSTGLSVGYVLWLVRGGVLLSSLLTSLPAWRLIDPLPILGYLGKRDANADEEDDSLESMLNKSNRKTEPVPNDPNEVTP